MRALVVEDSLTLRTAVRERLAARGWSVDEAGDGAAALGFLERYPYDVVVLDLMLPGVDGAGVLRRLRAGGGNARVLVLSALDQVADRVQALNLGADDYLVKPFDFAELESRILALMRRSLAGTPPVLAHGSLEVDPNVRVARVHGAPLPLSPKEYLLLEALLRQRGTLLTRGRLFEQLYDGRSEASDKVIEVLVSNLRRKLVAAGAGDIIVTRRGFGYVVP